MSNPARTTPGLVQGILLKDYDKKKNPSLEPFIQTATILVDRIVDFMGTHSVPQVPESQLAVIEMWLAAHFYCMSDITYMSRSTNGASGGFMGTSGLAL